MHVYDLNSLDRLTSQHGSCLQNSFSFHIIITIEFLIFFILQGTDNKDIAVLVFSCSHPLQAICVFCYCKDSGVILIIGGKKKM